MVYVALIKISDYKVLYKEQVYDNNIIQVKDLY